MKCKQMKKELIYKFRDICSYVASCEVKEKIVKKRYGKKIYKNKEYNFVEVNEACDELLVFLRENGLKWNFMKFFTNSYVRKRVDNYIYYHIDKIENRSKKIRIVFSDLNDEEIKERERLKSEFFEDKIRREIIPEFEVKESEMEKWS